MLRRSVEVTVGSGHLHYLGEPHKKRHPKVAINYVFLRREKREGKAKDERLRKKELDSGIRRNDGMGEEKVLRFTIYVLCFT